MIATGDGPYTSFRHMFGWNTFGPFKLVGGLKKGHPDADEIRETVDFMGRYEDDAAGSIQSRKRSSEKEAIAIHTAVWYHQNT